MQSWALATAIVGAELGIVMGAHADRFAPSVRDASSPVVEDHPVQQDRSLTRASTLRMLEAKLAKEKRTQWANHPINDMLQSSCATARWPGVKLELIRRGYLQLRDSVAPTRTDPDRRLCFTSATEKINSLPTDTLQPGDLYRGTNSLGNPYVAARLGTRRITAITGIKSEGNGTQSVEFTWEWVPTSLPADAAAEDFQYFGTFREFRTPLTGYSTFEKYDDGWRLRYATYTNVPPA